MPDRQAVLDDAAIFGMNPDLFSDAANRVEDFEVWQDNAETLNLFLRMATQWRPSPMGGGLIGLDYIALEAVARIVRFDLSPEAFDDVQAMERAALAVLNSRG